MIAVRKKCNQMLIVWTTVGILISVYFIYRFCLQKPEFSGPFRSHNILVQANHLVISGGFTSTDMTNIGFIKWYDSSWKTVKEYACSGVVYCIACVGDIIVIAKESAGPASYGIVLLRVEANRIVEIDSFSPRHTMDAVSIRSSADDIKVLAYNTSSNTGYTFVYNTKSNVCADKATIRNVKAISCASNAGPLAYVSTEGVVVSLSNHDIDLLSNDSIFSCSKKEVYNDVIVECCCGEVVVKSCDTGAVLHSYRGVDACIYHGELYILSDTGSVYKYPL